MNNLQWYLKLPDTVVIDDRLVFIDVLIEVCDEMRRCVVGVVTPVDVIDVGVVAVVDVEVEVVVVVEVVFSNHSVKILITLCEVSLKYGFQQSSSFDKFQIFLANSICLPVILCMFAGLLSSRERGIWDA